MQETKREPEMKYVDVLWQMLYCQVASLCQLSNLWIPFHTVCGRQNNGLLKVSTSSSLKLVNVFCYLQRGVRGADGMKRCESAGFKMQRLCWIIWVSLM